MLSLEDKKAMEVTRDGLDSGRIPFGCEALQQICRNSDTTGRQGRAAVGEQGGSYQFPAACKSAR